MIIWEDQRANSKSLTAYWVAFGPHGPRALTPPDEGKKVALYVVAALFVTLAIFSTLRLFAKPPPHTMTREWQEASNEYLKVRIPSSPVLTPRTGSPRTRMLTLDLETGAKGRPIHGCRLPQLHGQGPDPVPSRESLGGWLRQQTETRPLVGRKSKINTMPFHHGLSSMCTVKSGRRIGPAGG